MIKNKKILPLAAACFIAVETAMGIIIHTAGGNTPRFISVVIACAFCLIFSKTEASYILTRLALVCTVLADIFLLMLPTMQQLPAMILFSVTQLAYFLRIYLGEESKLRAWHVTIRAATSVITLAVTFAVLGSSVDAVAAVSMFYYANLIVNVVFAFIDFRKSPILAPGLLLFALCDAVIGLDFLDGYVSLPSDAFIYKIIHPGFDLAWAFYLPAQTLLALSSLKKD